MRTNRYLVAVALPLVMGLSSGAVVADERGYEKDKPVVSKSVQRMRLRTVAHVQRTVDTVARASTLRAFR